MAGKYALLIGNRNYGPGFLPVEKAEDDVVFLKELLEDPEIGGFEVIAKTNVENYQMQGLIIDFFQGKGKDDILLMYYSGHGLKDEKGSLRLAGINTEKGRERQAVPASEISTCMDECLSRRQILVLDCCYSGAIVKGDEVAAGTEAAFAGQGTGRLILTATDAVQYALQSNASIGDTPNSVFTHFLVKSLREGLKDKGRFITVRDWFTDAAEAVRTVAPQQSPRLFSRDESFDIYIARNRYQAGGSTTTNVKTTRLSQDELLLEFCRGGLIQATWSGPGLPNPESVTHQIDVTALDDTLMTILGELDAGALDGDRNRFMMLGERLFDTLCPGDVGRLVVRAVGDTRRTGRLHVVLRVEPDFGSVGRCPPEFLWVPADPERKGQLWLSYNNRVAVARRCASDVPPEPAPSHDPPIRVLLVVSKPEQLQGNFTQVADRLKKWTHNLVKPPPATAAGRTRTDPRGTRGSMTTRAQSRGQKPLLEITLIGDESVYGRATRFARKWDGPATWGAINQAIDRLAQADGGPQGAWQPDIIHFAGFGDIDGDGQGYLILEHELEDSDTCSAWDFRDLLSIGNWRPRLVVLEPCASGDQHRDARTARGFMALAETLVRREIVENAMTFQFPPLDRDEKHISEFLARFYAQLADGQDIDVAVQEGRFMITTVDSVRFSRRIFGAPVLFARNSGPLLQPTRPAHGAGPSAAARAQGRPAPKPREPAVGRTEERARAVAGLPPRPLDDGKPAPPTTDTAGFGPINPHGPPASSLPPSPQTAVPPTPPNGGPP